MSDHVSSAVSDTVGAIVRPSRITEEMLRFARTDDLWHYASNLNAMREHGYCNKCGLTPNGCEREGCRANAEADGSRASRDTVRPLVRNSLSEPKTINER